MPNHTQHWFTEPPPEDPPTPYDPKLCAMTRATPQPKPPCVELCESCRIWAAER